MTSNLKTSYGNYIERNCTVSITLDKRTSRKDVKVYPLSVRFTISRKRWYHHVGGSYSEKDFSEICNVQTSRSPKFEIKRQWISILGEYSDMLARLNVGHELSLELIRNAITGNGLVSNVNFLTAWQEVIDNLKKEDRYGTAESYQCGLNSFKKILGEDNIKGFKIDKELLSEWNEGMLNGVKRGRKRIGKISDTTRGIYLRVCRVIWNECIRRGYMLNVEYPFSNKRGRDTISIPRGATRKGEFLNVDKMTQLYDLFMEKDYPEQWPCDVTPNVHFSLGLFLAQYLCNGFNLADEAFLTYDDYYYSTGGKAFRFKRKKTTERSEDGAEVIIPIIEPLQNIINDIGAKPGKGALVFPEILKGAETTEEKHRRIQQENQNVRKRLHMICKDIFGWEERISGTWARHSFATNLRNAGVDMQYISESMGHSTQKTVTQLYLSSYPLNKQFEYNRRLLRLEDEPTIDDIPNMTKEQMQALLIKMMSNK